MNSENQDQQPNFSLFILLGAIIGAITGAGAGYLLSRRIEEGEDLQLSAGDGINWADRSSLSCARYLLWESKLDQLDIFSG